MREPHRHPGALEHAAGPLPEPAGDELPALDPEMLRAELEEQIRARPIISVLVGAAAGFLLGRLLRR